MATRPPPVLRDLSAVRMRASSAFALHALADLGPEHALLAAGLAEDPSTYGVLLPRDPERHVAKAVDHRAAGLLRSLAAPATVPGGDRDGLDAALAGLVLDGALEMETGAGFAGGPAAHALLLGDDPAAPPPDGAIAELSRRGLEHAQALPGSDAGRLSASLYRWNTIPLGPRQLRRSGGAGALAAAVPADRYEPLEDPGWQVWRLAGHDDPAELTLKLYVSPHPRVLADAFPVIAGVLADHDVAAFKLGRDAPGLLRPDKLVTYFASFSHLERTADALAAALTGVEAHPVPFSCGLTSDGLLSWGHDPPDAERLLPWQLRESWRLWVTNRLARALLDARADPPGSLTPAEYALDRLWLEGVDVARWSPGTGLWTAA